MVEVCKRILDEYVERIINNNNVIETLREFHQGGEDHMAKINQLENDNLYYRGIMEGVNMIYGRITYRESDNE